MPRLEDDLAASFRQGTYLARRNPNASPEALLSEDSSSLGGVSYALSALWVCRHANHRGDGPAGRAAYLARDSILLDAVAAHQGAVRDARCAHPPEAPVERYRRQLLHRHGLGSMPLPLGDIHRNGRKLEGHVDTLHGYFVDSHRYHFLTFFGDDPALGHAMAAYTAGGERHALPLLHLFDPNWGEFKVSARHALGFMARLLAWYDGHQGFGRITRFTLDRVMPME